VFPGKVCGIGERGAWGANNQHFARNRFEVSAKMDAAFQRDDGLLCGFDTQDPHHVLIRGLAFIAREKYGDAGCVDTSQSCHATQVHLESGKHSAGAGELPVAERFNFEVPFQRVMTRESRPFAQRKRLDRSDTRCVSLGCRFGVDQQSKDSLIWPRRKHGRQQARGVSIAASAGVILGVRKNDWLTWASNFDRSGDRFLRGIEPHGELCLGVTDALCQLLSGRFGLGHSFD
jgi:hypothetical protein